MDTRTSCFFRILRGIKNYELACGYYSEDYLAGQKDLSNTELQVLIQLDTYTDINANGIAEALWLEKSTIARAIYTLEKKGYLTRTQSTDDRREKVLRLTNHARPLLDFQIDFHQKIFTRLSSHLKGDELSTIGDYMKRFADGEGIADIPLRPGEVLHIVEMRRLGRSHSTIGTSFMNSGYSALEFQILTEIEVEAESLTPGMVSTRLWIPKNTLSQMLSRLRKKGLLQETTDPNDRRSKFLSLSAMGIRALEHIRESARRHYEEVFKQFTTEELLEFCTLFERYIAYHGEFDDQQAFTLAPNAIIKEISSKEERRQARGFHVLNVIRSRTHTDLPEELFHSRNRTIGLYVHESLEAIVEISEQQDIQTFINSSASAAFENSQRTISFYRTLIDHALRKGKTVRIPHHASTSAYRELLGPHTESEAYLHFKGPG